jgi:hypothetical protein
MTSETPEAAGETEHGTFLPNSWAEAERQYEDLGTTAQTVVREVTKAMDFDREEYNKRVSSDVLETARQALFAETLAVRVADRATFEAWRESCPHEVRVAGSDNVDRVAWHDSPPAETAVAATFATEPDAAVGTVRRMAFNRIYRDRLPAGEES